MLDPCISCSFIFHNNIKEIIRYDKLREMIDSWENKKKMKARRKLDKEEVSLRHSLYLMPNLNYTQLSFGRFYCAIHILRVYICYFKLLGE